jgi:hypothetical protein
MTSTAAQRIAAQIPVEERPERRLEDWLYTGAEIENIPVPEALVSGLIACGSLAVLVGKWKTMKSFVALDMACHVAAGREWCGRTVAKGPALYLLLEGAGDIALRYTAWRSYHGGAHVEHLHLLTAPIRLLSDIDTAELITLAKGLNVSLIVVDTLARAISPGDENGPDMSRLVANADRLRHETGAAVMLVHHFGKNADSGARGHSALPAAVDCELTVKRENESQTITVTNTLAKYFVEAEPLIFRAVQSEGSLLVVHDPTGASETALTNSAAELLAVIRDCYSGVSFTPTELAALIDDDAKTKSREPMSPKSRQRSLKLLVEAGQLDRSGTETRPRYSPAKWSNVDDR